MIDGKKFGALLKRGPSATLGGSKAEVYKMLKILKLCSKADIQSFLMKYSVDRVLSDSRYEMQYEGPCLQKVLRYWILRGKFNGVHPDLAQIGVKRIEVGEDGLIFFGA